MIILIILGYVAVGVFVVGMAARAIHFANTPAHLRWELYPVPHEAPSRAKYGGSYMEVVDFWDKKHETNHLNELLEMGEEIVLLKALWHHNRRLWLFSFPFHFGLYLLMVLVALLCLTGLLGALDVLSFGPDAGGLGMAIFYLAVLLGIGGFALGGLGALGLLYRRLTDEDLKDFTGPVDLLNLVGFVVLFGLGLGATALELLDPAAGLFGYFQGLFQFQAPAEMHGVTLAAIVVANLMVIYIPLTHMSHMVAKYFTYHSVRWNDEALVPGSKLDQTLGKQLQYPVDWSASHIGADGTRTWADIATTNPTEDADQ